MSPLLVLRFQFFTGGHWFTVRASTVDNLMVTESLLRQEKDLFTSVSDFFFFFFLKYCSREINSLKTLISWKEALGRGAAPQGMTRLAQLLEGWGLS